jgi:hypothetical protein
MEVAKALCGHCKDILGIPEDRLNVEFTQHAAIAQVARYGRASLSERSGGLKD